MDTGSAWRPGLADPALSLRPGRHSRPCLPGLPGVRVCPGVLVCGVCLPAVRVRVYVREASGFSYCFSICFFNSCNLNQAQFQPGLRVCACVRGVCVGGYGCRRCGYSGHSSGLPFLPCLRCVCVGVRT